VARCLGIGIVVALSVALAAQSPAPPQASDPRAPATISFLVAAPGGTLTASSVATDGFGNIYVGGYTTSTSQPPSPVPPIGRESWGRVQGFVAKFNPTGRPLWTTYIGGNDARPGRTESPSGDFIHDIAVDAAGQVSFVGRTFSTDLPVMNPFQHVAQAMTGTYRHDGLVGKLSADGQRFLYLSYFGGPDGESELQAVAVGPAGEAWVAGRSRARQLATHHDLTEPKTASGPVDQVFVLKLNPAGGVVWSTRMSGEQVSGFAVDSLGQPHIAATPGNFSEQLPYVAKLGFAGSRLHYQVSFQSSVDDLELLPDGMAVVSGSTDFNRNPRMNPWPDSWGRGNGFLRVLDAAGRTLTLNQLPPRLSAVHTALGSDGKITVVLSTSDSGVSTERPIVSFQAERSLYVSDDGAATWRALVGPTSVAPRNLLVDRAQGDVYIEDAGAAWRSPDLGDTWIKEAGGLRFLTFDPRNSAIRWGTDGVAEALYRRDADGTFSVVRRWVAANVEALAVSPHDGSIWVGSHNSGVETSADGGATWQTLDSGLPFSTRINRREFEVVSLAFDPEVAGLVYAAASNADNFGRRTGGVFVKRPNESRWVQLTADPPMQSDVRTVVVDPRDRRRVYAGTTNQGLIRSVDAGASWHIVLAAPPVSSIAFDPNRPGVMYAAADTIYRSLDAGATWIRADAGYRSSVSPRRIVVEPRQSRIIVAPDSFGDVPFAMQLSTDGGLSARGEYRRYWATYLEGRWRPADVAASAVGPAVVLLTRRNDSFNTEFAVVQIGR
jgi:photosystem II stability/assembly factor-like uncharacterized protein